MMRQVEVSGEQLLSAGVRKSKGPCSLICGALAVGGWPLAVLLTADVVVTFVFALLLVAVEPSSNFTSFSDALYFAAVTLTTVGYGDITPVTDVGRFFAVLLTILGAGSS